MQWKSPEPARLHEIARHFREFAGETCSAEYIRMMIRTADDLESLAANLERAPEPMPAEERPGAPDRIRKNTYTRRSRSFANVRSGY